jgi:hypothetical protein
MSYNAGIEVFAADAYQSWINDYSETSPVAVQGAGWLSANFVAAEPLTAA